MKPTNKQIELCDRIIQELNYWKSSNDIDSPSHNTSIEELISDFEMNQSFKESLIGLLCHIKTLDRKVEITKKSQVTDPALKDAISSAKKELSRKRK